MPITRNRTTKQRTNSSKTCPTYDAAVQGFSADDLASDEPEDEVARLRIEAGQANDRALRVQAELENYRKRARRDLVDQQKYAGLTLLRDLLPVVDNLNRAINASEQSDNASSLLEGVQMVATQLGSVLERHGCVPMDVEGETFDPHTHEGCVAGAERGFR